MLFSARSLGDTSFAGVVYLKVFAALGVSGRWASNRGNQMAYVQRWCPCR